MTARKDAVDWKILDLLLRSPIVTSRTVAEHCDVSADNARKALERLESTGILTAAQLTRSTRAWRAPDILILLDDFARQSRRLPGDDRACRGSFSLA
ncbi:winged helix-turn-helix transcriptional regulator [Corynebacterium cystitidis]|uniref:winged helix-turn-helix transcriptional regulator n=1 Tax=Corynebacterium cystitidis TaxID=35757 RepID=UPI00211DABF8|nr:winged helix-turn-helix transcriptional regulator [Corynebacterium cystitidis]